MGANEAIAHLWIISEDVLDAPAGNAASGRCRKSRQCWWEKICPAAKWWSASVSVDDLLLKIHDKLALCHFEN